MSFFIGSVLEELARQRPERELIRAHDGRARTAGQLDKESTTFAGQLLSRGLLSGERVAVWMEDEIECVVTYFALAKAGITAVPIGKMLTAEEASFILQDVEAVGLIYSSSLDLKVSEALKSVPTL